MGSIGGVMIIGAQGNTLTVRNIQTKPTLILKIPILDELILLNYMLKNGTDICGPSKQFYLVIYTK